MIKYWSRESLDLELRSSPRSVRKPAWFFFRRHRNWFISTYNFEIFFFWIRALLSMWWQYFWVKKNTFGQYFQSFWWICRLFGVIVSHNANTWKKQSPNTYSFQNSWQTNARKSLGSRSEVLSLNFQLGDSKQCVESASEHFELTRIPKQRFIDWTGIVRGRFTDRICYSKPPNGTALKRRHTITSTILLPAIERQ